MDLFIFVVLLIGLGYNSVLTAENNRHLGYSLEFVTPIKMAHQFHLDYGIGGDCIF